MRKKRRHRDDVGPGDADMTVLVKEQVAMATAVVDYINNNVIEPVEEVTYISIDDILDALASNGIQLVPCVGVNIPSLAYFDRYMDDVQHLGKDDESGGSRFEDLL